MIHRFATACVNITPLHPTLTRCSSPPSCFPVPLKYTAHFKERQQERLAHARIVEQSDGREEPTSQQFADSIQAMLAANRALLDGEDHCGAHADPSHLV